MNTQYTTKDFYLTAYLLASGFQLNGHIKSEGLTIFAFEETPALSESIRRYYDFRAQVNPITLGNAMRSLKSIIHENTNGTEQYHSQPRKGN
jgi:hypothetical protein